MIKPPLALVRVVIPVYELPPIASVAPLALSKVLSLVTVPADVERPGIVGDRAVDGAALAFTVAALVRPLLTDPAVCVKVPPVTSTPPLRAPVLVVVPAVSVTSPDTVPLLVLSNVPAFDTVPVQVPSLASVPPLLVDVAVPGRAVEVRDGAGGVGEHVAGPHTWCVVVDDARVAGDIGVVDVVVVYNRPSLFDRR